MRDLGRPFVLGALLAGVVATGCGNDPLVGAEGTILVDPSSAEFPLTYVGHPTHVEIALTNTGRAAVDLRTRIDRPFSVDAPDRLPGAGELQLVVTFAPAAPGPAAGTLSIDAGSTHVEVTLSALARSPPSCVPEPCHVSYFDANSGTCVEELAPTGTSCSTTCVPNGTCLDGTCRSSEDPCDDGDACTIDRQASDCSCRHDPVPDRPAADACHREVCENKVWKVEKAADGTACGPVNECTGQFCADGVCGPPQDAPEGMICRAGTPCRKPGRCVRSLGVLQCSATPEGGSPTPLRPVWRVAPVAGRRLHFEAVADERYLYWVECNEGGSHAGCGLRSVLPLVETDGVGGIEPDPADFFYEPFDRYAALDGALAPMFTGPVSRGGTLVLFQGLLFSTYRPGWLEAYNAETGEAAFRLDLSSSGQPVGRGGIAVNAHGQVVLLLADSLGVPRTVTAVTPAGVPFWVQPREGVVRGLVADENGNVFFHEETPARSTLVSLDGAGQERFAVDASPRVPLAAFAGRVLHGDGTLYDALDGRRVGATPLLVPDLPLPPLLDAELGWLAGYPVGNDGPDWTSFSLQQFALASAAPQALLPLSQLSAPWDRSEPLLLATRSMLLSEGDASSTCSSSPSLAEWPLPVKSPMPRWSCPMTPGSYGGPTTVQSSLFIAYDDCLQRVSAFLLAVAGQDGPRLADRGWIGGGGERGRGNRPLP